MGATLTQWAAALLYNGIARYDDAFIAADTALEDPGELWFCPWATVELIEAASRSGRAGSRRLPWNAWSRAPRPAARSGPPRSRIDRERYSRGPGRGQPVPRRDRPPHTNCAALRPRPHTSRLRRVAATERRNVNARAAAGRARALHRLRHGGIRGASTYRAPRDGRTRSQTHRRDEQRPHASGGRDLAAHHAGEDKRRDLRAALHQPEHRRIPPAQGLPEDRCEVADALARHVLESHGPAS